MPCIPALLASLMSSLGIAIALHRWSHIVSFLVMSYYTLIFGEVGSLQLHALECFPLRRDSLRTFQPPRPCVEEVSPRARRTYLHAKLDEVDHIALGELFTLDLHQGGNKVACKAVTRASCIPHIAFKHCRREVKYFS